ncbi:MAG: PD40 domain-containing protein, partial [Candidatus Dormibacteraeota bacterium]|nr:PD40 domain-containing protein [Candidatus Dormibacteraeota bacterium]
MLPPLIPRSVLFGNPTRLQPRISPDGKRLAYLAPLDGVLNVWVGPLDGGEFRPVTEDRDRGIRSYRWAHDNRHLLHVQDRGGDEDWHLYATDPVSARSRDLTPFERVQARLVATDRHHPETVLVGLNRRSPELHDVYRLDLPSGALELAAENPGGIVGWMADRELRIRGATRSTPDAGRLIQVRDTEEGPWRVLYESALEDGRSSYPVALTADGSSLLMVSSRDANTGRLLRLPLDGRAPQVLYEDPGYDVVGVVTDPESREPQLLTVLRERADLVVLDPRLAEDLERVRELHAGEVALSGRDHADRTWVVAFTTDDGPVSYFTYDRVSATGRFLFSHRQELEGRPLAK